VETPVQVRTAPAFDNLAIGESDGRMSDENVTYLRLAGAAAGANAVDGKL
jgi:hypothetical protein